MQRKKKTERNQPALRKVIISPHGRECVLVCTCARVFNKSCALDKDPRISAVRMPPPVRDVIPLAGDKASLLLVIGQICSCTDRRGRGGGGDSWGRGGQHHHSRFRTVQPARVRYILGAEAIDLLSSSPHANTYKHTLLPLTYGLKCITLADPVCQHSWTAGPTYSQPFRFSK